MMKRLDDNLKIGKKPKRNALEQCDWQEMLEVTDENCINIIYEIFQLTSTNIKKLTIEIGLRMKNGATIVKSKIDRHVTF